MARIEPSPKIRAVEHRVDVKEPAARTALDCRVQYAVADNSCRCGKLSSSKAATPQ